MQVKLLLVGEAWGASEGLYEHALVGKSGVELAFMLSNIDLAPSISMYCSKCKIPGNYPSCAYCGQRFFPNELDMIRHWKLLREDFHIGITNVFNFHPPDNDIGFFFDNDPQDTWMPPVRFNKDQKGRWVKPEHRHHVERLWEEIKILNPNLIVCLGNCASWAILKEVGIGSIRGTTSQSPITGHKVLPTYHPAGVLRQWSWRPIVLADLSKAKREMAYPEIRRIDRLCTIATEYGPHVLDEIDSWLNLPADEFSVDVESGYALFTPAELKNMTPSMRGILSSQLSMVGFARSPTDAMNITFLSRNEPNLCFWPNKDLEICAWNLLQKGLSRPEPKIFQNGIYDLTRLMFAGRRVVNPKFDTMLHHHSLYPEMLKGLGFLGSVYCNEAAWKTYYKQGELKRDS